MVRGIPFNLILLPVPSWVGGCRRMRAVNHQSNACDLGFWNEFSTAVDRHFIVRFDSSGGGIK